MSVEKEGDPNVAEIRCDAFVEEFKEIKTRYPTLSIFARNATRRDSDLFATYARNEALSFKEQIQAFRLAHNADIQSATMYEANIFVAGKDLMQMISRISSEIKQKATEHMGLQLGDSKFREDNEVGYALFSYVFYPN